MQLREFLADEPRLIQPSEARAFLEHGASCDECAELLARFPGHVEVILASSHPAPDSTPELDGAIARDQQELLIFGRAVLRRLADEQRNAMGEALPAERCAALWAVSEGVSPGELRAALAVSEASLALGSLLARTKGESAALNVDGTLTLEEKEIPAAYFAARIAEYADIEATISAAVWVGIVQVIVSGSVGLPGIYGVTFDGTSSRVENFKDEGVVLIAATPQGEYQYLTR